MISVSILLFLSLTVIMAQQGAGLLSWFIASAAFGVLGYIALDWSAWGIAFFYAGLGITFALSLYTSWMKIISQFFYKNLAHFIPQLSDTEEQALKVGDA